MQQVLMALFGGISQVLRAAGRRTGADRGDVPGWVLVTVMTAGLVMTLWLVADDQLSRIFSDAIGSVTGP
jgi:hypothetical protein